MSYEMALLVREEVAKANPHLRPYVTRMAVEGKWQVKAYDRGELVVKLTGQGLPPE